MLGVPCFSIACTFLFCIYIYSVTEVYVFPGHKLRLSYSCRTEDVKQNGILILSLKYPTCVLIVCRLFKIISSLQSTSYKNSAGVFKVLITSQVLILVEFINHLAELLIRLSLFFWTQSSCNIVTYHNRIWITVWIRV